MQSCEPTAVAKKLPPEDKRKPVIVLKGSKAYHEWLAMLSRESLIPVASIVRDALAKWAMARGYAGPPKF